MKLDRRTFLISSIGATILVPRINAQPNATVLTADASKPFPEVIKNHLKMGPTATSITADSRSLIINGKRAMPVMGEFHFSRYPENEWREELLKMKMGGIDIVASYVFWIHHEEVEGKFDWSGQRNLRKFVELAKEAGLMFVVRLGPWCHGEVRNGGLPDWLLKKPYKARTDAPEYLANVDRLYGEIAAQIKGLYHKDGGPIIGAQFENEFKGRAEHLLNLKRIALKHGIDVPLYTRTAWHGMASPLPVGEIVPLFGAYAEGFWDREITPMPGKYGDGFLFRTARTDASIATDQLGAGARKDSEDLNAYPYFCCEIGGGMMPSYHRRILNYGKDIESIALVKLGSGSNLQGFYMYHGGTNPEGKLSTLQESQATNYWNDLPVKSYDFQAPLREYGQLSPHYHALRLQNMFLRDFGEQLADMPAVMPDVVPKDSNDAETLRWSVRTDGTSGFIFVNNYHRLKKMPAKENVQFTIKLKNETMTFPKKPMTIPADFVGIFPFNLNLERGWIEFAPSLPLCKINDGRDETIIFRRPPDSLGWFGFGEHAAMTSGYDDSEYFREVTVVNKPAVRLRIALLNEKYADAIWKCRFDERDLVFITRAGLLVDGDTIRLASESPNDLKVAICFGPVNLTSRELKNTGTKGGVTVFEPAKRKRPKRKLSVVETKPAGPPREIKNGSKGVAEAPSDADFDNAAVWKIELPKGSFTRRVLIRVKYEGDVARAYVGDRLLTDNFYNGTAFEFAIDRDLAEIRKKGVTLKILPLRKDAPIYLADEAKPKFENGATSVCRLISAELVEIHEATLRLVKK